MRVRRGSLRSAIAVAALAFSLAGCTSNGGGAGAEGGESPSTEAPQLATEEPTAVETPFETEPEVVDVPLPEAVDPGKPEDVDGRQVLPAVELDDAVVEETKHVTVWLDGFTSVEDAGSLPGQVGGPSVQFDVFVHNSGTEPLDLATLVVTAEYGDKSVPAEAVTTEQTRPLVGTVEPDGTIRGTLVFAIPSAERDNVQVNVDLVSDARVIAFQGAVPK
ncbi:MAG: DUF4352 domain-containing protein [Ancrocorticia sp.]